MMQATFETFKMSEWFSAGELQCVTFQTLSLLPEPLEKVRTVLSRRTQILYDDVAVLPGALKWWGPIGLCVFCVSVWLPASMLSIREVTRFTAILLALQKIVKREAAKATRRDGPADEGREAQVVVATSANNETIVLNVATLGFIGVICVMRVMQASLLKRTDQDNGYIDHWTLNALSRMNRIAEALLGLLVGVLQVIPATTNRLLVKIPLIGDVYMCGRSLHLTETIIDIVGTISNS
jgi:hypothetical protein